MSQIIEDLTHPYRHLAQPPQKEGQWKLDASKGQYVPIPSAAFPRLWGVADEELNEQLRAGTSNYRIDYLHIYLFLRIEWETSDFQVGCFLQRIDGGARGWPSFWINGHPYVYLNVSEARSSTLNDFRAGRQVYLTFDCISLWLLTVGEAIDGAPDRFQLRSYRTPDAVPQRQR